MNVASVFRGWGTALRQRFRTWAHLPRLLRSLWNASPALAALIVVLRLLRAVQPPLVLFIGKLIIDEIVLQTATPAPGPEISDWLDSGAAGFQ
ncbi:hypothetical protein [Bosea lathyri]|uniref:ATP-binding cassette, subfamily B n=1 Tax=Bosea lathyri TaxID=1036778 RepID=A0A1H6D2P5_9HYPH|nr:hypothetical protein [Bosea lathyri]SEG79324.1 ATP-binding cassette, subfamily B [Bosea lathyri]